MPWKALKRLKEPERQTPIEAAETVRAEEARVPR
jgi:hypothetical protein